MFPHNYGFINVKENQLLIIGGKCNSINKKDKQKENYKLIIKDEEIEIEKEKNFLFPKDDEFNGKMFNYLGDGLFGEFSSLSHKAFYLVNMFTKKIEQIN